MEKFKKQILDLGCGLNKKKGAIGVDINLRLNPDVCHDLNITPFPFEDDFFDEIYCEDTVIYIANIFTFMEEIYRISKFGASIKIVTPYFRSKYSYYIPNIKSLFSINSLFFFDARHPLFKKYQYTEVNFQVEKVIFNENITHNWYSRLVTFLANKYPNAYEVYFSHLFPLDRITYYLKKQ